MTSSVIPSPLTFFVPVCVPEITTTTPTSCRPTCPTEHGPVPALVAAVSHTPLPSSPPQQQTPHTLWTRALHAYPHSVSVAFALQT